MWERLLEYFMLFLLACAALCLLIHEKLKSLVLLIGK